MNPIMQITVLQSLQYGATTLNDYMSTYRVDRRRDEPPGDGTDKEGEPARVGGKQSA